MVVIGQVSAEPTATFDGSEKHDVKHGKEHAKVAPWRNPKLDIRHTLKRALDFGHAGDEAKREQKAHLSRLNGEEVA